MFFFMRNLALLIMNLILVYFQNQKVKVKNQNCRLKVKSIEACHSEFISGSRDLETVKTKIPKQVRDDEIDGFDFLLARLDSTRYLIESKRALLTLNF